MVIKTNPSVRNFSKGIFLVTAFIGAASCSGLITEEDKRNDAIDRQAGLTRQQYLDQLTPKPTPEVAVELKAPKVPEPADLIINPPKPRLGVNKTVSLSVTEDVPLKDVFIELARLADVDIEIDPAITGGVIFKAKNRPFDEVVERISDMANLKYTVKDGVIRIMVDQPYVQTYQMAFLNLIRTGEGNISSNTTLKSAGSGDSDSSSGSGSSGGSSNSSGSSNSDSGGSNGSDSKIGYKTGTGDIWASVISGISTITNDVSAASTSAQTSPAMPGSGSGLAPMANLRISVNREAGVVSIKATEKEHAAISEYLQKVKQYYSAQVLIEAKVVEIALNDQFRSGVDWNIANARILGGELGANVPVNTATGTTGFQSLVTPDIADDLFSTVRFTSGDLNVAVRLAEIFGTTRTLSSPRILAMNNQPATLSFAENANYFTLKCEAGDAVVSGTGPTVLPSPTITSELNSIPIGVILSMIPAIDTSNSQVALSIRPTLTRLTGESKVDPALVLCASSLDGITQQTITDLIKQNPIPQVDVREMDSVLKIRSGEILVIGGMIDQKIINNDSGVPVLSDIPYIGNAFKAVDKTNQTTQTVIFLKATIIPGYGVDTNDQELYNKFNTDPRPLKF